MLITLSRARCATILVAKSAPALIPTPGKTRITIRIDDDVLEWFREQIRKACGGSYQTMMNDALRAYMNSKDGHAEELLRKVIREELRGVPHEGEEEVTGPPFQDVTGHNQASHGLICDFGVETSAVAR